MLLFTIMLAAGIVPLIMAVKVKVRSLRILSLLLGLFFAAEAGLNMAAMRRLADLHPETPGDLV